MDSCSRIARIAGDATAFRLFHKLGATQVFDAGVFVQEKD
jgi:hypothetical protein